MAVRYTLVESNTTDIPGAAAATFNRGFNIPGGAVDEIIMRVTTTNTTQAIQAQVAARVLAARLAPNQGGAVADLWRQL